MATTSTNKQPLLVDRLLHYVVPMNTAFNNGIDPGGTNAAIMLVDATTSDGAILEDIYAIGRSTTPCNINFYVSPSRDYLRPNEGVFVGRLVAPVSPGAVTSWESMPKTLTPVPHVGTEPFNRAFYLPKGLSFWAARDDTTSDVGNDAPLVGCQGGWF